MTSIQLNEIIASWNELMPQFLKTFARIIIIMVLQAHHSKLLTWQHFHVHVALLSLHNTSKKHSCETSGHSLNGFWTLWGHFPVSHYNMQEEEQCQGQKCCFFKTTQWAMTITNRSVAFQKLGTNYQWKNYLWLPYCVPLWPTTSLVVCALYFKSCGCHVNAYDVYIMCMSYWCERG